MNVLEFKTNLFDLIRSINDSMASISKPDYEAYGLTAIQARILIEIYICQKFTVGELGKLMMMSSGNMSNLCKKMEKQGFIKRIRDKDDERVVKVILTEEGSNAIEKIVSDLTKKYIPIVSSVSQEDFQKIIDGLKMLDALFKKIQQASYNNIDK